MMEEVIHNVNEINALIDSIPYNSGIDDTIRTFNEIEKECCAAKETLYKKLVSRGIVLTGRK